MRAEQHLKWFVCPCNSTAIARNRSSGLYVADTEHDRILMLNRGDNSVSWKVSEVEMVVVRPTDGAVDMTSPRDRVFVTDRLNGRSLVFERR